MQKCSMDSGTNLVETAQMVLDNHRTMFLHLQNSSHISHRELTLPVL